MSSGADLVTSLTYSYKPKAERSGPPVQFSLLDPVLDLIDIYRKNARAKKEKEEASYSNRI